MNGKIFYPYRSMAIRYIRYRPMTISYTSIAIYHRSTVISYTSLVIRYRSIVISYAFIVAIRCGSMIISYTSITTSVGL